MAVSERALLASPIVSAAGRVIASPFQFTTTGEDRLQLIVVNSVVGVVVQLRGRFLDAAGTISASAWTHTPTSDRTATVVELPIAPGAILNLQCYASGGAPQPGQCFVIVQLIRGSGNGQTILGTILQGSITSALALGFPGSPLVSSTDGEPAVRTIIGTLPAAGADILETVPTAARWELMSVQAPLIIGGAGVASPTVFTLDDGANVFARSQTTNAGGAGTTNFVSYSQGVQQHTAGVPGGIFVAGPIAGNRLPPGSRFRLHTDVNPAQVVWATPIYNVREWLELR